MSEILSPNQLKYLRYLRGEVDPLVKEMEDFAIEKRIPILDWKAAEFLELIVEMIQPKKVLEIGTAIAYSSIRIAKKLKKKAFVDTIEKSLDNISLASDFITRAGLKNQINLIEGDALSILPLLEKKYNLIFLDADKEDYEKLFYFSLMLLKKGGVIFIDNLLWHGYAASNKVPPSHKKSTEFIRTFNRLFLSQKSISASILPIGDGIGLGVKL